jgi:hypothetical protein
VSAASCYSITILLLLTALNLHTLVNVFQCRIISSCSTFHTPSIHVLRGYVARDLQSSLQTASSTAHSENEEEPDKLALASGASSNKDTRGTSIQNVCTSKCNAKLGGTIISDEQMQAVRVFWGEVSSAGIWHTFNESRLPAKAPCAVTLPDTHHDKFHDLARRTFGSKSESCADADHRIPVVGSAQSKQPPVDTRSAALFRCACPEHSARICLEFSVYD